MELVLWVKAQGLAEEWDRPAAGVVWVALDPVQALVETVSAQTVALKLLTAEECPATISPAPNVGRKWLEGRKEKP